MRFFSIIIPNYNHATFLPARIESVLNQTFQQFEIILLDDASTDNSLEIIERYRNHPLVSHVVVNERNSGSPFKQWQKGIALASAPWIWIAESDDKADPNFLETAYDCLTQHDIRLFYSNSFFINANDAVFNTASVVKNDFFATTKWSHDGITEGIKDLDTYLKFLCIINNASAMVVQKSLAADIIEKSATYTYYGDWVFYINAFRSARIGYCCQPLCYYRTHAASHVNPHTDITKTKHEYFQVLQYLLSLNEITGAHALISFFALHYLGFGIVKEGLMNGLRVFRQYWRMDKKLAWQIIRKILYCRFTFQRNKKQYP